MKSRIPTTEIPLSELYIRILPIQLAPLPKAKPSPSLKYRIFLEKGLQVMGKSEALPAPTQQTKSNFDLMREENFFDFQLVSEKNMMYDFVIYETDDSDREERIEKVEYNLLEHYNTFMKKKQQAEFDCKIQFKSLHFLFEYKLYIHNVSQYIGFLTSRLLKSETSERHTPSQLKLQSKAALNKIQQLPSEQNFVSNLHSAENQPPIKSQTIKLYPVNGKEEKEEEQKQPEQVKVKKGEVVEKVEEQVKSSPMKKIVLIVMIMLFVLGLMGSGIIPVGKKTKKGKKKGKSKY